MPCKTLNISSFIIVPLKSIYFCDFIFHLSWHLKVIKGNFLDFSFGYTFWWACYGKKVRLASYGESSYVCCSMEIRASFTEQIGWGGGENYNYGPFCITQGKSNYTWETSIPTAALPLNLEKFYVKNKFLWWRQCALGLVKTTRQTGMRTFLNKNLNLWTFLHFFQELIHDPRVYPRTKVHLESQGASYPLGKEVVREVLNLWRIYPNTNL